MIHRKRSVGTQPLVDTPKKRLQFLPGQMLLKVKEEAIRPHLGGAGLRLHASEAKRLPEAVSGPLDYLRRNAGLKSVTPLFSAQRGRLRRASIAGVARGKLALLSSVAHSTSEALAGITLVEVDPRKLTPKLMKHLEASNAVEFVEAMPARWIQSNGVDPLQNVQWGLRAIEWFAASRPVASQVTVGVLDTGVDAKHPDLKGVIREYHHEGLKSQDLLGHGTHVAGIIAATTNNAVGITGVATCRISMWKVFQDQPESDGEFYVDGERYLQALGEAIDSGVKALNLSLGGTASSQTERILFRRLEAAGVVVVAAMGNEYQEGNPTEYPAAYPGVLSVGALAENRRRSSFSNTGRHLDLVAPGSNILSTLPRQASPYRPETGYDSWSGTSMATPHVAGAAALVAAHRPSLTANDIKKRLRATTSRLTGMNGKQWTSAYGTGLLNLRKALS